MDSEVEDVMISLNVPAKMKAQLQHLASKHERSVSGEIRHALRGYIDDHQEPSPF